jgi:hypothetical protein
MGQAGSGVATTLPAGAVAPVASLEDGKHTLVILKVAENMEMRVKYPDGWERDHQAKDIVELAPKIVNNLRTRYGVESAQMVDAPKVLEVGATIVMEVANGKQSEL